MDVDAMCDASGSAPELTAILSMVQESPLTQSCGLCGGEMADKTRSSGDAFNRYVAGLKPDAALPTEPEIAAELGISRSMARAILLRLSDAGIIRWNKRQKIVLAPADRGRFFPEEETNSLHDIIERSFMLRILSDEAQPGMQINELELAREIGTGTSVVREFLIRVQPFRLDRKATETAIGS